MPTRSYFFWTIRPKRSKTLKKFPLVSVGFLQYILDDDGSIEHILESRGRSFINVRIVAKLIHYILAFAGSVVEAEVGLFFGTRLRPESPQELVSLLLDWAVVDGLEEATHWLPARRHCAVHIVSPLHVLHFVRVVHLHMPELPMDWLYFLNLPHICDYITEIIPMLMGSGTSRMGLFSP